MPRVIVKSKAKGDAATEAFVARPTKWGNPFSHLPGTLAEFRVDSRDEAVSCYEEWIQTQPHLMAALGELAGKDLVCFCAPQSCHADVLLKLANDLPPTEEQATLF